MAPVLPGPEARAPPTLSDHPLEEILVRLGVRADVIRASAACKAFRRIVTDAAFLRRYRSLHPPLLLGFVGPGESAVLFLPAEAPHPNAPAARAFAAAADFSFDHYHPDDGQSNWPCWPYFDARDGRVLLISDQSRSGRFIVSPELAVCDPLTRDCTLLPPIPDNLRASVLVQEEYNFFDAFFDPSGGNEEALFREEAQFRVMCWARCSSMAEVFVYSSVSGSWSHGTSIVFSVLGLSVQPHHDHIIYQGPSYVYGCLYWDVTISKMMIKLDINSMESTTVSLPSDHENRFTIFVEAGDGRIGMFSLIHEAESPKSLHYSIRQNEGENANEHPVETTILLPSEYDIYYFCGAAQGYIFLLGEHDECSPESTFFSVEIKTLKVERVSEINFGPNSAVWQFRPFMSPRRI